MRIIWCKRTLEISLLGGEIINLVITYTSRKIDFKITVPDKIKFPMSIDNAKKLFGNEKHAFCETLFTVKPVYGIYHPSAYGYYLSTSI